MRAFRVAYDGIDYRGFQRQPHGETVEDELLSALRQLGIAFEDGTPPGYAAAGRTDAGVSARAQTIAFEAPEWLTPRAFNGELPADVRAWAYADVDDGFHATRDAATRTYRYVLVAPDADDDLADAACRRLSGQHDFHNLTPDDERTARELEVTARREGEECLVVECRAGGFSRQLVRRVVSVLGAIARGERGPEFLDRVLAPEPLPGSDGVGPAPPEPLVLTEVSYPGVRFQPDAEAKASTRAIFEERRRRRVATAAVAGMISDLDS